MLFPNARTVHEVFSPHHNDKVSSLEEFSSNPLTKIHWPLKRSDPRMPSQVRGVSYWLVGATRNHRAGLYIPLVVRPVPRQNGRTLQQDFYAKNTASTGALHCLTSRVRWFVDCTDLSSVDKFEQPVNDSLGDRTVFNRLARDCYSAKRIEQCALGQPARPRGHGHLDGDGRPNGELGSAGN